MALAEQIKPRGKPSKIIDEFEAKLFSAEAPAEFDPTSRCALWHHFSRLRSCGGINSRSTSNCAKIKGDFGACVRSSMRKRNGQETGFLIFIKAGDVSER
jgi:hypothetical protein